MDHGMPHVQCAFIQHPHIHEFTYVSQYLIKISDGDHWNGTGTRYSFICISSCFRVLAQPQCRDVQRSIFSVPQKHVGMSLCCDIALSLRLYGGAFKEIPFIDKNRFSSECSINNNWTISVFVWICANELIRIGTKNQQSRIVSPYPNIGTNSLRFIDPAVCRPDSSLVLSLLSSRNV